MGVSVHRVNAQEDDLGAIIRGKVLEKTSTERIPLEGVTVKIVNAGSGKEYIVTTDKEGKYEKKGLPAGRYIVSFAKKGYSDRVGKARDLAPRGEIYNPALMTREKTFYTYLFGMNKSFLVLILISFTLCLLGLGYLIYYLKSLGDRSKT